MTRGENRDLTRDIIVRVSPARNTLIVEEQKPGGIVNYKEIDPVDFYFAINKSYVSRDLLSSGFLPEHCLHISMNTAERQIVFGIQSCGPMWLTATKSTWIFRSRGWYSACGC